MSGSASGLARIDARVAFALFQDANDRLAAHMEQVGGASFSTLRQRSPAIFSTSPPWKPRENPLVARPPGSGLAQHVGSDREVVAPT